MRTWPALAADALRTRLWPIPTIAVVLAVALGLVAPELEAAAADGSTGRISGWVFGGDADAARSLLSSIASSLITVTALTFSLTVVTLQLASSQFSPRLLRTFTRDRFVQVTLALFLATFTYALTVLRAVEGSDDSETAEFVPEVAVTVAFVLTVVSVVALVLFLAHLTEQIRVETMLRNVHRDAVSTLRSVCAPGDVDTGSGQPPRPPSWASVVLAEGDGFVTWVDQAELLAVAVDEDVVVSVETHPGVFVVRGTPVGRVWSTRAAPLTDEDAERVGARVSRCLHLGFERTSAQDVGFGLRQLTDVANKALSPGVNDPTTAVHALGHISALLCDLADADLGSTVLRDDDGARVVLQGLDLADYLDLGLAQPRLYGATDPQVLTAVARALLDLGHRVDPTRRPAVRHELDRLRRTVAAQSFDPSDRVAIDATMDQVLRVLGGEAAGPERH